MASKVQVLIRLNKETDVLLRSVLPAKRGALSQFVEEAILEKLERDHGIRR